MPEKRLQKTRDAYKEITPLKIGVRFVTEYGVATTEKPSQFVDLMTALSPATIREHLLDEKDPR